MPAHRAPKAKLIAKGSIMRNPKLFRDRHEPATVPLGGPSPHVQGPALAAWLAFQREIPWLAESDRAIVETACHVRGRLMEGQDVPLAALTVLRQCLAAMGATPADRSRISVAPDEAADPTDGYFN